MSNTLGFGLSVGVAGFSVFSVVNINCVHIFKMWFHVDLTYGPGDDDVVLALRQPKLQTLFLHSFRSQVGRDA